MMLYGLSKYADSLNSHLWYGSGISILSCLVVTCSYAAKVNLRCHPAPLIYWRSISDLALSILIFLNVEGVIAARESKLAHYFKWSCEYTSWIFQFTVISAESWLLMISIDLLLSVSNPFTSFKKNIRSYHFFVWTFSGIMALMLQMGPGSCCGPFIEGICWITAENPMFSCIWVYFAGWVIGFYLISIFILVYSFLALQKAKKETYGARNRVLRSIFLCMSSYAFHLSAVGFIAVLVLGSWQMSSFQNKMYISAKKGLSFVFSAKGFVDLFVWVWILPLTPPQVGDEDDVDTDLSPQLNTALQKDIVNMTTLGIKLSVMAAEMEHGDNILSHPTKREFILEEMYKFKDYHPEAFFLLRGSMEIGSAAYLDQVLNINRTKLSEGASGAFMFFSADNNFIIKTVSAKEQRFLHRILPKYTDYIKNNQHSLVVRIYGSHSLHIYGQIFRFVVMQHILSTHHIINLRYDIKGSWIGREAVSTTPGSIVKCRHCNQKYKVAVSANQEKECPLRVGPHEPNIVLKDNDLVTRLQLSPAFANQVFSQLVADSEFLCALGIMDYSLLIGVHYINYEVNPYTILDDVSVRFQSYEETDEQFTSSRPSFYSKVPNDESIRNFQSIPWAANQVVGPGLYFLGIIDILQTWDWMKKIENYWKVYFRCFDRRGISCISPAEYKERFQNRARNIIQIHNMHL